MFSTNLFDEFFAGIFRLGIVLLAFLPLGIWKAVEIVVWLVRHISVTWG